MTKILATYVDHMGTDLSVVNAARVSFGKKSELEVVDWVNGRQVYDLSDPAVPAKVMYYPTSTEIAAPNLYRGAWGVYPFLPSGNILVSDMQNGLFVIEKFGKGVATHDTDDLSLSIYPNPATDHIYVTTGDAIHNIDLTIMDLSGKVVLTRKVDTGDLIDIGSLASGLYTVTMKWENQIVSKQIVVR